MTAGSAKCSPLFVSVLLAILPVAAQTSLPVEGGLHPNLQPIVPQRMSVNLNSPQLASPISISGPADPTEPSRPLLCNREVQKEFRQAFMKTRNGEDRGGLAEAGRSIELVSGSISFGAWMTSSINNGDSGERANKMDIRSGGNTIAVFHTHGNNARAVPSAEDLRGDVPDFVISRFAVYVTIPGTGRYLKVEPAVCR